ncbi:MAG: electron transfer flavoprotein beta subunit/FixA family protein [Crocinitomicaceae bacterium]|nr:electron transfer flavoprotein beta subunit/FixA family protein [Crocinitomicaceae bacterium]MBT6030855.1 electron transfer flavoprotein beta subunit/FixA family protein [Crocinitomicaceae bacterium]MDG2330072.1 electron transfer flavoprotein beta subunit/FixA family protein [Flavobacteriales bacterium]
MKLLVCISKAPDTTAKIAFTDGNTKFDENGVQFIVNPYDEWYALVRALELTETTGGTVTTITVGTNSDDPTIRKALAIGATDAVRIDAVPKDAYYVANQIASYAKTNEYDIILTGKETINYNGAQVGAMIAEILDQPFVSLATKLDIQGNAATLERDVSGGVEVVEVNTPFVLSAAKGMSEQRIPNMRGIMAARTKPLHVIEPVASEELTSVVSYSMPDAKAACKYVDAENAEELINLLHTEAKVI